MKVNVCITDNNGIRKEINTELDLTLIEFDMEQGWLACGENNYPCFTGKTIGEAIGGYIKYRLERESFNI